MPVRYTYSVVMKVVVTKQALRQVNRAPHHIATKLWAWVAAVEAQGLEEVRKVPGFNDHPLKGKRAGERAIRLSYHWRAIYIVEGEVIVVEVHPHAY